MAIAQGIAKKVAMKREAAWGEAPGKNGAQSLRRVTSDLDVKYDVYTSNEIRPDQQDAVSVNGTVKVEGTLSGELSPGSYADIFASLLRRDFVAGATLTQPGISLTQNGFDGADFVAAGFKTGTVVRATGFANELMNNNNFLVLGVSATEMRGVFVNETGIVDESPAGDVTIAVVGGLTSVPKTGHTDVSVSIEHWFSDVGISELYTGLKPGSAEIAVPATGASTVKFGFTGKRSIDGTTQYFTDPAEALTTQALAGANGLVYLAGKGLTLATSATINISANVSTEAVIGSRYVPSVDRGRLTVEGQLVVFFQDAAQKKAVMNDERLALILALPVGNTPDADCVVIHLPSIKLNGASKNDGEKGLVQTIPFKALITTTHSTIEMQDSFVDV
jgi:hypothetical protein